MKIYRRGKKLLSKELDLINLIRMQRKSKIAKLPIDIDEESDDSSTDLEFDDINKIKN